MINVDKVVIKAAKLDMMDNMAQGNLLAQAGNYAQAANAIERALRVNIEREDSQAALAELKLYIDTVQSAITETV